MTGRSTCGRIASFIISRIRLRYELQLGSLQTRCPQRTPIVSLQPNKRLIVCPNQYSASRGTHDDDSPLRHLAVAEYTARQRDARDVRGHDRKWRQSRSPCGAFGPLSAPLHSVHVATVCKAVIQELRREAAALNSQNPSASDAR